MCGRYSITTAPEPLRQFLNYVEQPNFPPRYNIAPTQPIPIIHLRREANGVKQRHFLLARWGFLPGFVKEPKEFSLIINARAETATQKPSFRNAMKRRRCLIVADAYYEWRREPGAAKTRTSRPYIFRRADAAPLIFAGLWETWCGADGSELDTACILTTQANGATVAIHDRMPAILEPTEFEEWQDCDNVDEERASRLLRPAATDVIEFFEIETLVNKVANSGPEIQAPKIIAPCQGSTLP
jgi:putative SOS response-associated peptidase YedK